MIMKRLFFLLLIVCLLAGCADSQESVNVPTVETMAETVAETVAETIADSTPVDPVPTESAKRVLPLPDTTAENLADAILAVSLEEGSAYLDETSALHMELKVYSYDLYDMVDIAGLEVGDIIVKHSGDVKVTSIEQRGGGIISINGGLEYDGFDLVTDDSGIYYEVGFNDHKNWYEARTAILRVSTEFVFTDCADLDVGEVTYYAGSFLNGEVTNYDFSPYNTTVRVEGGQIVEMNRRYIP